MLKTGFRGERKRILTPSLSQGEGECSDGKNDENFFIFRSSALAGLIPSCRWLSSKGECGDGKAEKWRMMRDE